MHIIIIIIIPECNENSIIGLHNYILSYRILNLREKRERLFTDYAAIIHNL